MAKARPQDRQRLSEDVLLKAEIQHLKPHLEGFALAKWAASCHLKRRDAQEAVSAARRDQLETPRCPRSPHSLEAEPWSNNTRFAFRGARQDPGGQGTAIVDS